ncbi:MAG TPA: DUF4199 domain-containing protein [Chitinophaga sp.]|uniref:DUF4199 domain-containing protein n=1 Tax=Chitinophaga sp. TaxID=1869181 RepID=UPI002BDAB5E5|nr:DUF4199 domain-containing protein [Chitinophaga sp.]HVI46460.1 DUF4199 domain-containing protein [Chitinophaga sp.]
MKKQNYLFYGLSMSIVLIVLSLLYYFAGLSQANWTMYINIVVLVVGIIVSCNNYSQINDGKVTFGNIIGSGFKATLIIVIVNTLFSVFLVYIFPDIKQLTLESARKTLEKQGQQGELLEQSMRFTEKMFMFLLVAGSLFSTLVAGTIAAIIGAAVGKKEKALNR